VLFQQDPSMPLGTEDTFILHQTTISTEHKLGLILNLGLRSAGYVTGEMLDGGLIFRAGLNYHP